MHGSPDLIGEATAELRQALAIDPRFAPARFYLAHLYLDMGRAQRAREELRRPRSNSSQATRNSRRCWPTSNGN